MQKRYSEEFKQLVIKKMMPPNPVPVSQLCKDTGVSDVTLYKWRKEYRNRGIAVPITKRMASDDTLPVADIPYIQSNFSQENVLRQTIAISETGS